MKNNQLFGDRQYIEWPKDDNRPKACHNQCLNIYRLGSRRVGNICCTLSKGHEGRHLASNFNLTASWENLTRTNTTL